MVVLLLKIAFSASVALIYPVIINFLQYIYYNFTNKIPTTANAVYQSEIKKKNNEIKEKEKEELNKDLKKNKTLQ